MTVSDSVQTVYVFMRLAVRARQRRFMLTLHDKNNSIAAGDSLADGTSLKAGGIN